MRLWSRNRSRRRTATPVVRRRSLTLAVATAVLSSGVIALVGGVSAPAVAQEHTITQGPGLDWGVKESWRRYIGPLGTTLSGGAEVNDDGTFHFPVAGGRYEDATKTTVVEFEGGVEFIGHCTGAGGTHVRPCALDMTLTDFRIELTEDHASVFVTAMSRPIDGGDLVRSENVPIVDLDLEGAEPQHADGVTTWSDLPASITLQGNLVFSYGLGTLVDPVSFGYEGPGGKPAGETWDEPGRTLLREIAADPQPDALPERILGTLSTGELVGFRQESLAILDPDTLQARSAWVRGVSTPGSLVRDSVAIDPATDTIFAAEATTNRADRKLVVITWDGTDLTVSEVVDSYAENLVHDGGNAGTWDAANGRYVVSRAGSPTDHHLWQVTEVDGAWTAERLGPISQPKPGGALFENGLTNLEAVPDGAGGSTFIATTLFGAGHVVRLTPSGSGFRSEPLREAGDIDANRLVRTENGVYALGFEGIAYLPFTGYADRRGLGQAGEPVAALVPSDSNRNRSQIAFDHATDALIVVTDWGTTISRLEEGDLVYAGALESGAYGGGHVLGLDPAGDVWGVQSGQLNSVIVAGSGPRFVAQPEPPVADLTTGSAEIELSVDVAGDPQPALVWQTRVVGGTGWADVEGAHAATLTQTVTADDAGRQYRVIAENAAGRVASHRVSVDLQTPPSISVQPDAVTAEPGADVEFKVMPQGNPEPSVQWQQRVNGVWSDVDGGAGATLAFDEVDRSLSGAVFRARLSNPLGVVYSRSVSVTVEEAGLTAPSISAQPTDLTGVRGAAATLSVTAEGGELAYQWQRQIGSFWVNIGSEAELVFDRLQAADTGRYRVTVSNPRGAVTSDSVTVRVDDRFSDVPAGHAFDREIAWLAATGITRGYADGSFRPGAPVTRGSMAALLYRAAGEPEFEVPARASFSDVGVGHRFQREIEWLAAQDITRGYADGSFRPGAPVTRGSMAALLYRAAGEPEFEVPARASFSDVGAGHGFQREIEWLAAQDITRGYADGSYRSGNRVTRQAMAAFLHRVDGQAD